MQSTITKQEKAAILLKVLINAGISPDLDSISTPALKNVVDIMANFGDVGRETVDLVILEFLTELGQFGLSMRGDLDETLSALKGHVSDKVLDSIRKAFVRSPNVDPWTQISSAEASELRKCLSEEHINIGATVLSKVPSTLAAEVLGGFEPAQARSIMLAIINAGDINDDVVEIIGQNISRSLFSKDSTDATAKSPVERAGDIMNFAPSDIRNRMMDDFNESDPEVAEKIRKVMFTFPDIPDRVVPRDISSVTRVVDPEILLKALKGAETAFASTFEFILSNLPTRAAAQLREDLAEMDPVKKKESEAAMNEIIVGIRNLESSGDITLIMEEEEE